MIPQCFTHPTMRDVDVGPERTNLHHFELGQVRQSVDENIAGTKS